MSGSNILVLGGGGAVGRPLALLLAEQGHTVTAGGRTLTTLETAASQHPSIRASVGDARVPESFAPSGPFDAVVNTTGIEDPAIDAAWSSAGNLVIDIAASGEEIAKLERLESGPGSLVLSVGLIPGLTTLMATELSRESAPGTPISIGVLLGAGEAHGDAAIGWTMSRLGRTAHAPDGAFRNFTQPVKVDLPGGFGRRTAWRFDFADQVTVPAQFGNPVTTAYCFDSKLATTALAAVARIPGAAQLMLAIEKRTPAGGLGLGGDWWAGTVRTADGAGLSAMGRSQSFGTAVVAAAATDRVVANPPAAGIHHLNKLMALDDLSRALRGHDIWVGSM